MDISSATSSLYFPGSRYADGKKGSDGIDAFLDLLKGHGGDLSSLTSQSSQPDGLPVEIEALPDGLPVEKRPILDGLPVEKEAKLDGLPVEPPEDPYVDPQILLTQKLAASLFGSEWRTFDRPMAAVA